MISKVVVVFWIIDHRKAKKGHAIDELVLIKLFSSSNYEDLFIMRNKIVASVIDMQDAYLEFCNIQPLQWVWKWKEEIN